MKLKQIFENNKSWISEKLNTDKDFFRKLAEGQKPEILYIGCSDSRVAAEEMMGAEPGDLFVHRNIANVVANIDINVRSVINFAVVHLQVKNIIVCGHYGCGGVKAAMQSTDLGILNPWLQEIRDVYCKYKQELDLIHDEDSKYKRLIELNVMEQCSNVLKIHDVQKRHSEGHLEIHGWVFDMGSGKLIDLNIKIDEVIEGFREVYMFK